MKKIYLLSLMSLCLFAACKKKETEPINNDPSKVQIVIANKIDEETIELGDRKYTNSLGQPFQISILKYFLSNFEFVKSDGSVYTVPQDLSYFLINQSDASSLLLDMEVPAGDYTKVRFMLGVDSLRNTMSIDKRQGDLDPTETANGMYWTWNSGYIHFMFEGKSALIPTSLVSTQKFTYHIGGFGGYSSPTPNNTRIVELDLDTKEKLQSKAGKQSYVYIDANLNLFFNTKNIIDFTVEPLIMTDADAIKLADNAKNIFKHNSTINE